MTVEEANQIFYINLEIKTLRLELARLEESRTYYQANKISDMPKGGRGKDVAEDYLVEKQKIEDMLNYALRKLQIERERFEKFLQGVDDPEARLILRLRCVNNLKWEQIGEEIGMDRRTASRKFYGFFEKCPQCPRDL